MHPMQERLLRLSTERELGGMTLRGIGGLIGESYAQKVKHHLLQLQKKGLIRIDKKNKQIQRVNSGAVENSNLISVPIYGAANCGDATLLAEDKLEGYLMVSSRLLNKHSGIFALKADGSSMNRALVGSQKIEHGDYLIVDGMYKTPVDGDIVVSIINGMANVKRFKQDLENNQIILFSESIGEYPPIYIHADDDFHISGKVIQVIKKP